MAVSRGYHFFINPGPTNIPDRILRAMDRGAIDFNGAQFRAIAEECFAGLKRVFKTDETILAYAASGHGAWEAALVNLFSPGDKLLMVETGHFSQSWAGMAHDLGLEIETVKADWRKGARKSGYLKTQFLRLCWHRQEPRASSSNRRPAIRGTACGRAATAASGRSCRLRGRRCR